MRKKWKFVLSLRSIFRGFLTPLSKGEPLSNVLEILSTHEFGKIEFTPL